MSKEPSKTSIHDLLQSHKIVIMTPSKSSALAKMVEAKEDVDLAKQANVPRQTLTSAYDAIRKAAAGLLDANGYRARAIAGAHITTFEATADLLSNYDTEAARLIATVVNETLRPERNAAEYSGGVPITKSQANLALTTAETLLPILEQAIIQSPEVDTPSIST